MAQKTQTSIETQTLQRLRTRARLLALMRRSHALVRPSADDVRLARLAVKMAERKASPERG